MFHVRRLFGGLVVNRLFRVGRSERGFFEISATKSGFSQSKFHNKESQGTNETKKIRKRHYSIIYETLDSHA